MASRHSIAASLLEASITLVFEHGGLSKSIAVLILSLRRGSYITCYTFAFLFVSRIDPRLKKKSNVFWRQTSPSPFAFTTKQPTLKSRYFPPILTKYPSSPKNGKTTNPNYYSPTGRLFQMISPNYAWEACVL